MPGRRRNPAAKSAALQAGNRRFCGRVAVPVGFSDQAARSSSACSGNVSRAQQVFVLPNPSGRNANFSYAEMLAAFRSLRRRLELR